MNFFFLIIGFHLLTDLEEHTQEGYILVGRVEKSGWKASVLSQFDRSGWQHENWGPREGSGGGGGERETKRLALFGFSNVRPTTQALKLRL